MSNLFWLSVAQVACLEPVFPKPHGKPRVDDRRVLSGIIFINRNGLRWRNAPPKYGPPKTLYNRWKRWSEKGVFARILLELAGDSDPADTLMIAATHLRAHTVTDVPGAKVLLADRGYVANWLRKALKDIGITPCIPSRKMRRAPVLHDADISKRRHKIENSFARLKDRRRVATRDDRCPKVLLSAGARYHRYVLTISPDHRGQKAHKCTHSFFVQPRVATFRNCLT